MDRKAAWEKVRLAAQQYTSLPEAVTAQALAEACLGWASAKGWREPREPRPGAPADQDLVMPFGRSKGKRLPDANTEDLEWMTGILRESVAAPDKAQWRTSNQQLLDAVEAELERR